MVTQGKTDEQIADILGRSKSSIVTKRIEIFGVKKKYKKRRKVSEAVKVSTGGAAKLSDLEVTQRTLKALGYKLALVKLGE